MFYLNKLGTLYDIRRFYITLLSIGFQYSRPERFGFHISSSNPIAYTSENHFSYIMWLCDGVSVHDLTAYRWLAIKYMALLAALAGSRRL